MYAVVFRAEINVFDSSYTKMAEEMRELAIDVYGCTEFIAVAEGSTEITISYWQDEASINAWKKDAQHLVAQQYGRDKWYKNYQIEVVKVLRSYKG